MKTFVFIFARGGSKGVPGKNIRLLAGKPLIAHALEVANQIPEIEHIFVSTDLDDIANIANQYGAIPILRPSELAQDGSPEWLAWRHAINWVKAEFGEFDRFLSLPPTAPLRIVDDVILCLNALDTSTDVVVTMTAAQRSPWFNMAKVDEFGLLRLLVDGHGVVRRQDAPIGYDLTTVAYVLRPDFILKKNCIWDGCVRGVVVSQDSAIDIDSEFDFTVADFLMRNRQMEGK